MQIELKDVSYTYGLNTVYEVSALSGINLSVKEGEFIAIAGQTGSGKSTLIQHLNGLIRPTSGRIFFEGKDIWEEGYDLRELRTHVGLVFQYPENQLFETTVVKDVMFGPRNQGLSEEECRQRAEEALKLVGIPEELLETSPFDLSGGQKRRVAVAGVLAMNPEVLILDEPTAGLDPAGREEILTLIRRLRDRQGITIILVSHSMEDVASYAGRMIVIHQGKIAFDGTPRQVFAHYRELEEIGLAAPQITYIMHALKKGGLDVDVNAITVSEAKRSILLALAMARSGTVHV